MKSNQFKELSTQEVKEVNGGFIWKIVAWLAVEILANPQDAKNVAMSAAEDELSKIRAEFN